MLITGASSGIGRALAVRAARAGYAVYAVARDAAALEALRARIEAESGMIATEAVDIAVPSNARAIVARTLARFGSIDVLVNNAGFVSAGPLAAQSDEEMQRQFGTHVIGPIALVREALDALRQARGQVFVLGSGVARVPIGGLGAYPPAKAAVRSATAILRRELAAEGVAVTYVDPGAVDTPFMKRAGMPGAPGVLLVSPEAVARKMLIAVGRRPRELNAVAWQTTLVALAERFPRLTDRILERAPGLIGGQASPDGAPPAAAVAVPAAAAPVVTSSTPPSKLSTTNGSTTPAGAVIPAAAAAAEPVAPAEPVAAGEPGSPVEPASAGDEFAAALEPHRRRMEKLNFRASFVRDLLVPDATLDLGEIALRWAGMPNKNERAITEDVLEALAAAGFLEPTPDHAYRVVRVP